MCSKNDGMPKLTPNAVSNPCYRSATMTSTPAQADSGRQFRRALWRSRRGMLELDLLLVAFARRRYLGLSTADQDAYQELLTLDDWQIWNWLHGRQPVPARFAGIVERIAADGSGDDAP